MTSELRPAVEVLEEAARHETYDAAVAVIEADREAVRHQARDQLVAEICAALKEREDHSLNGHYASGVRRFIEERWGRSLAQPGNP